MSAMNEARSEGSAAKSGRKILLGLVLVIAAAGVGYLAVIAGSSNPPKPGPAEPEPTPVLPTPKPVAATPERAGELFREGKYEEAMQVFDAAAKADATRPPGRVALAELFAQANQPGPARFHLELAAGETPDHPAVFLLNGAFAIAEGRATDAILSYRTANDLAGNPRYSVEQMKRYVRESRLGLAAAYELRQDWPAVQEQLADVVADDPNNGLLRERLAATLFRNGDADAALAEYRAVHAAHPELPPPELHMALLWTTRNDAAQAEDWFQKAVAAHGKNPEVFRTFAGWLLDSGRVAAAVPIAETAFALDPKSRESQTLQGVLARYRKDHAAAEAIFEQLYAEDLADRSAAWNLALALADSDDAAKRTRAVSIAESEIRKNNAAAEAYAVLGWCYFRVGRLAEAKQALDLALASGSPRADTIYYWAKVQAENGEIDEPIQRLTELIKTRGPFVYRKDAETLKAELEAKKAKSGTTP